MKRKATKDKTLRQQRRDHKNNLAQSYYARSTTMLIHVFSPASLLTDATRVIIEVLPSTARPNIMGVYDGSAEQVAKYIRGMVEVASEAGLTVQQEVSI
jgi:hypothetical protein